MLDTVSLSQHVKSPTNPHGNILDLIITSLPVKSLDIIDQSPIISDHFLLNFSIELLCPRSLPPSNLTVTSRNYSLLNLKNLSKDLKLQLISSFNNSTPESALSSLTNAITSTLNVHAPLKTRILKHRPNTNFYTSELRTAKRNRRALEKKRNKARNTINFDRLNAEYKQVSRDYINLINNTRTAYLLKKTSANKGDTRALFKIAKHLSKPSKNSKKTTITPNQFSDFFQQKIEDIRQSILPPDTITNVLPDNIPPPLSTFSPTCVDEVAKIIANSRKTFSPLDPIPSRFYSHLSSTIAPYLVSIFNLSMSTGTVPSAFKHAAITPILKNPNCDINNLSNYRPISLLTFQSKILERIIVSRLNEHLSQQILVKHFSPDTKGSTPLKRPL